MEAILNFIPAPIALLLMLVGFISLAIGCIRLGYKQTVKSLAYDLVCKAEDSIMGSGQGAKKKGPGVRRAACRLPESNPVGHYGRSAGRRY